MSEIVHEPSPTRWHGHWSCDCGYVGTEEMMGAHMHREGWCSECWGSGADAYPSLGICRECGGTGEVH